MAKKAFVYNKVNDLYKKDPELFMQNMRSSALDAVVGIGGNPMTYAGAALVNSAPANAPELDRTQSDEYRKAQEAVRKGLGSIPEWTWTQLGPLPLWLPSKTGITPQDKIKNMEQEQAAFDEQYRKMTGMPSPTEQRKLQEMNAYNMRAYAPFLGN